jgi:hypothetical protein
MTTRELIKLLLDAGNLDCQVYVGENGFTGYDIEKVITSNSYSANKIVHIEIKPR